MNKELSYMIARLMPTETMLKLQKNPDEWLAFLSATHTAENFNNLSNKHKNILRKAEKEYDSKRQLEKTF